MGITGFSLAFLNTTTTEIIMKAFDVVASDPDKLIQFRHPVHTTTACNYSN